ncbi:hypothetical protein QAA18_10445 [Luteimonas sp. 8-5]|jgi:hypothetical protein|uniref:hypothetical protein n=1 Tax=Luteimonas sp. 8-5 TaxID=3039387 RepID=UPI0024374248|nr:hypothetical protein [Luteimonas sp. 8-5]MDG6349150.1 hypothetical protein [Luteimonas sp. 8-5]
MTDAMLGLGLFSGILGLFVFFFLLLVAIVWFFLPFAIFGTKGRLDTLIAESRRTNELLTHLLSQRNARSDS